MDAAPPQPEHLAAAQPDEQNEGDSIAVERVGGGAGQQGLGLGHVEEHGLACRRQRRGLDELGDVAHDEALGTASLNDIADPVAV